MHTRFLRINQSATPSRQTAIRIQPMVARAMIVAAWLLVFGNPALSFSHQQLESWEGRRVMVVREGVQFRVKGESKNVPAPLGTILEVSSVNGQWLWFKGQRGWMEQKDVVPYDKAIDHFTAEIQRDPSTQAYRERGIAHAAMTNFDKAIPDFTEAINRDPNDVATYNDRGNAYRALGQLDEALTDFTTAIDRGVRHPAVFTNRGLVWAEKEDHDKALADFNSAISIDDRFAPAWDAGGAVREAKGDFARAIANYKKALEVDPNFDRAHNNLGWIMATNPGAQYRNAQAAIRHATKACELTSYDDAGYLDTLAAAYAEAGQFDEAVKWAKKALDKVSPEQKEAIGERLQLYEMKSPFRHTRELRV